MERKIGAAPGSRLGGTLSDLQLNIVRNVIEHLSVHSGRLPG
jgi:hypothetical protein